MNKDYYRIVIEGNNNGIINAHAEGNANLILNALLVTFADIAKNEGLLFENWEESVVKILKKKIKTDSEVTHAKSETIEFSQEALTQALIDKLFDK